jgi:DNA-binding MarR family transcriptional regulator
MAVKEEKKTQFIAVIFNLVKALKNESEACCKICGNINEKELMIVVFVGQNENVKMSDIAADLDAPLSTLTTIVDKLVENKYLIRDHSHDDRRVINVSLAQKGKDAYKSFLQHKRTLAEKVLAQFNEKEQNTFLQQIQTMASVISLKK